jgi:hypothetical protein
MHEGDEVVLEKGFSLRSQPLSTDSDIKDIIFKSVLTSTVNFVVLLPAVVLLSIVFRGSFYYDFNVNFNFHIIKIRNRFCL